jgi:hypothetical protein
MDLQLSSPALENEIKRLLDDNPSVGKNVGRWAKSVYHNQWPRRFRFSALVHWTSRTAMASSGPAVAYFMSNAISVLTAALASGVIFIGHSLVGFFDTASKEKKSPTVDSGTETIIRFGEILAATKPRSREENVRDDAVRAALGVIEIFARQVTGCEKGELSVSVALYTGSSEYQMCIRHRNPGNIRPIGRKFDGRTTLGHHACRVGSQPRVIHDIRGMSAELRKSPTQSAATYRSFLLLPLVVKRGSTERIGGFLSIDSTRPYCFFGKRARILVVDVAPIIAHIQDLL